MAGPKVDRVCQRCGEEFIAVALAKWCSEGCRKKAAREQPHVQEREKAYRAANKSKMAAYHMAYRETHSEQIAAQKAAWYSANTDWVRAQHQDYAKRNPGLAGKYSADRRARVRLVLSVSYTVEQLKARFDYFGNRCWICGAAGGLTIDHVKPISKGGPHCLSNIRPACQSCNSRKNNIWPIPSQLLVATQVARPGLAL